VQAEKDQARVGFPQITDRLDEHVDDVEPGALG
jgi:hypothetical protein